MNLYRAAWTRHRDTRIDVYKAVREDAITNGGLGEDLRITDIDDIALAVWERSWTRRKHSHGAGGWNWPELVGAAPRRAAVLPIAIWYGDDLCGFALGQASRSRAGRVRHTVTLTFIERRPEPPPVPLRGHVVRLAISVGDIYGRMIGAKRLVLRSPALDLLRYYDSLGFDVAWAPGRPALCMRRI